MKARVTSLVFLFGVIFSSLSFSQASGNQPAPQPVLVDGDVTKFIETLPKMRAEFEALGVAHDADQNAWLAHAKAQEILSKYGWDFLTFGLKWTAIASSYAYLKATEGLNGMSAEERAQAEPMMATYLSAFLNAVHENDIALVRGHEVQLDGMFGADEN